MTYNKNKKIAADSYLHSLIVAKNYLSVNHNFALMIFLKLLSNFNII
jgi:hypothetical protein